MRAAMLRRSENEDEASFCPILTDGTRVWEPSSRVRSAWPTANVLDAHVCCNGEEIRSIRQQLSIALI